MRLWDKSGLLWIFRDLLSPGRSGQPAAPHRQSRSNGGAVGLRHDRGYSARTRTHRPGADVQARALGVRSQACADVKARDYGMPLKAVDDGLSGSALWTTVMYAFFGLEDDGRGDRRVRRPPFRRLDDHAAGAPAIGMGSGRHAPRPSRWLRCDRPQARDAARDTGGPPRLRSHRPAQNVDHGVLWPGKRSRVARRSGVDLEEAP